jgi:hypothetical protein
MLHRGKYAVDGEVKHFEKLTVRNIFKKMIGITPDYTLGDKIIAWTTFLWTFVVTFLLMWLGTIVWNLFTPWPIEWWGWRLFIISVVVACIKALISMVWFMIGGIIDMRQMFRDLAARTQINELDNGMVSGHVSLADQQKFSTIEKNTIPDPGPEKSTDK